MSLISFVGTVRERPRVREVDLSDFGSTDRNLIDMSRVAVTPIDRTSFHVGPIDIGSADLSQIDRSRIELRKGR